MVYKIEQGHVQHLIKVGLVLFNLALFLVVAPTNSFDCLARTELLVSLAESVVIHNYTVFQISAHIQLLAHHKWRHVFLLHLALAVFVDVDE